LSLESQSPCSSAHSGPVPEAAGPAPVGPLSAWLPASDWRVCLALFGLALLLCAPYVFLQPVPLRDVASRYAPMVRAFAEGHIADALHPRVQPLFVLASGALAWCGVEPFAAVKLASSVFFAVAVFPVFWLHRLLFGRAVAVYAGVLYVLCPRLVRIGAVGLRDSLRTLLLVLAVAALVAFLRRRSWRAAFLVAVSTAGMVLTRGDAVPFALCVLLVLLVLDGVDLRPQFRVRFPGRALAGTVLAGVLVSPWVIFCIHATGYPVTATQQIPALRKIERVTGVALRFGTGRMPESAPSVASAVAAVPAGPSTLPEASPPPSSASESVWALAARQVVKGLFPVYVILALPVVCWRVWRRQVLAAEWLVLGALGGHVLLLLGMLVLPVIGADSEDVEVPARYFAAGLPFLLGWAAMGLLAVYSLIVKHVPLRGISVLANLALVVVVAALVWDGQKGVRFLSHGEKAKNDAAVRAAANWMRQHYVPGPANSELHSTWDVYQTGRRPVVVCADPATAYLAGGDFVSPRGLLPASKRVRVPPSQLRELCREVDADLVVWDEGLAEICPDLRGGPDLPGSFDMAFCAWEEKGQCRMAVLSVRRAAVNASQPVQLPVPPASRR